MFSKHWLFTFCFLGGCASSQKQYSDFPDLIEDRIPNLNVVHFKKENAQTQSTEIESLDAAEDAPIRTRAQTVDELLTKPLTAQSATQIGILNSPSLTARLNDVGIQEGLLLDATLLENPELNGSALFQKGRKNPYLAFEISQNISSIIFRSDRKTIGKAQLEAAHYQAAEDVLSLTYQIEQVYYRYLANQQKIDLLKQIISTAQASFEMAEELFRAGTLKELDLKNQHILFEETKLLMLKERTERFRNREALNALLGLRGKLLRWKIPVTLPSVIKESLPNLDTALRTAKKNSLLLGKLNAKYKAEDAKIGLAESQGKIPNISLGAEVEQEESGWRYGPTFEFGLPILNQNQGQIAISKAKREQIKKQYTAVVIDTQTATRASHFELRLATEKAKLLEKSIVPLRKQALEQAQRQYNAMSLSVFELLQFKRAEIEASLKLVDALQNYWLSYSTFVQLISGRIAKNDSLRSISPSTTNQNPIGLNQMLEGGPHD